MLGWKSERQASHPFRLKARGKFQSMPRSQKMHWVLRQPAVFGQGKGSLSVHAVDKSLDGLTPCKKLMRWNSKLIRAECGRALNSTLSVQGLKVFDIP